MALDFDPPGDQEALRYFRNKGFKVGFDYRDVWREEHATAFTVAKATEMDVLTSIRGELDRALSEGRTFRDFQKNLEPTLQKLGWWGRQPRRDPQTGELRDVQLGSPRRLRTIYRVNMRTARSAGQWERAQRTKQLLPYFLYALGPSENHREQHVAIAGTIRPVDDAFWDEWDPPNGYGCKCRKRQISRKEAERRGGVSERPDIPRREWRNKRTGEVESIPEGIQPSFNQNWGKNRRENLDRLFAGKLDAAEPVVAQAAVRDAVSSPAFDEFLKNPTSNFPVMRMGDEIGERMGTQKRTAVLSPETMTKQQEEHPDVTPEEYRFLPGIGEAPAVVLRQDDRRVLMIRRGGERHHVSVVKTDADRAWLGVVSFRRARPKDVQRLLEKHEVVSGSWE